MMEERLRSALLDRAREYARLRGGISLNRIGKLALNDPKFFVRLDGRTGTFTVRLYDRATAWFDANWPEDARPRPEMEAA